MTEDPIAIVATRPYPRYLSREVCAGMINAYEGDTIKKWLRLCDIPPSGTVHQNRESLLELIELYHKGDVAPNPSLTKTLITKLNTDGAGWRVRLNS